MAAPNRKQTQGLHLAVFNTYLPPHPPPAPRLPGAASPRQTAAPPPSADAVLQTLTRDKARIPGPLLGLAVWNLLPHSTSPAARQAIGGLLSDALDLDVDAAQRIRRARPTDVLPPYPDRFVLDSAWRQAPYDDRHGSSRATLEVCVPTKFDAMRTIVNPGRWSGAGFFWQAVPDLELPVVTAEQPGAAKKQLAPTHALQARLNLPGDPHPAPVTVDVRLVIDPFEARADFAIRPNAQIELCRGYIRTRKEPGRPEATRVTMQRILRLRARPPAQLEMVKYWLHSEAACLALPATPW